MTGLEKILKHIEEDAAVTANAIIAEAESKAKEITALAYAEGEKKRLEIEERSKLDVKSCLSRAESAALLQEKKIILNAKQDIINDVILRAKESVLELPDKEYFDVILKMVKKHALGQAGQISFSQKDKNRLPQDFEDNLRTALAEIKGAKLTISEKTCDIDGGFILVYGDVEENCSFNALFFAAKETLQDKVCKLLFE